MKKNIEIINKNTKETHVVTVLAEKIENPANATTKKLLCAISDREFTYVMEIPFLTGEVWYTDYSLVWSISDEWSKERIFNALGFPVSINWL